jgi:hypothetical protein
MVVPSFSGSENGFTLTHQTDMAAQGHAEELFGVAMGQRGWKSSVWAYQWWFSSGRYPLLESEGAVARLVHKPMGKNITGPNRWQEESSLKSLINRSQTV